VAVAPGIRPARFDEAAVLARLQEEASLAAFAHVFPPERYPFPRVAVLERWTTTLSDPAASVLVAERNGSVVGLAAVRADWLDGLYVHPDSWGTGVGRILHDESIRLLRHAGCRRCHLWVLEQNRRARHFYERLGWRENGAVREVPFPPNPLDVGYTLDLGTRA
jgi:GNAT superfamily N-acetyltransferase